MAERTKNVKALSREQKIELAKDLLPSTILGKQLQDMAEYIVNNATNGFTYKLGKLAKLHFSE